jgi:hypothetical protein
MTPSSPEFNFASEIGVPHMKKFILTAVLLSFAAPAWAGKPSKKMVQIVGALVNNPQVSEELKNNNITSLTGYEISEVKQGVNKYNLSFQRGNCECLPGFAQVEIIEDLTPTYREGAPIYTTSVSLSK